MEKLADSRKSILAQLNEVYPNNITTRQLNVYPQMPSHQIQHYITLAARKNRLIIIQLNPSSFSDKHEEVVGGLQLSPQSSHVILTPKDEKTIHLIQPQFIRHVRLAQS